MRSFFLSACGSTDSAHCSPSPLNLHRKRLIYVQHVDCSVRALAKCIQIMQICARDVCCLQSTVYDFVTLHSVRRSALLTCNALIFFSCNNSVFFVKLRMGKRKPQNAQKKKCSSVIEAFKSDNELVVMTCCLSRKCSRAIIANVRIYRSISGLSFNLLTSASILLCQYKYREANKFICHEMDAKEEEARPPADVIISINLHLLHNETVSD